MLRYFFSVTCIGFAIWAAQIFVREYGHFREISRSTNDMVQQVATTGDALANPPSLAGQVSQMRTCIDTQQFVFFGVYPPDIREAYAEACIDRARATLSSAPSMSAAWLALGVSQSNVGRADEARVALYRSRLAGGREGWLASRRVETALDLDLVNIVSDPEGTASDILLMAGDRRLREELARLFAGSETHRDAIISVLEQAPTSDQTQFLRAVRRLDAR